MSGAVYVDSPVCLHGLHRYSFQYCLGKIVFVRDMKACRYIGGGEVQCRPVLTLAIVGGEWQTSLPGRFSTREIIPGILWIGGWMVPGASLRFGEERSLLLQPISNSILSSPQLRLFLPLSRLEIRRKWIFLLFFGDVLFAEISFKASVFECGCKQFHLQKSHDLQALCQSKPLNMKCWPFKELLSRPGIPLRPRALAVHDSHLRMSPKLLTQGSRKHLCFSESCSAEFHTLFSSHRSVYSG